MELKIEYIPIDNITPYEKNANRHDKKSVEAIKNSITEFEMCDPIGVWGDKNIIVEGHGRLMALKELGYTEAPIIRLDHLTDEQRRAYTLAHNKTNEFSEWDINVLDKEIDDILNIDMSDFGFDKDVCVDDYLDKDYKENERARTAKTYKLTNFDKDMAAGKYQIPILNATNYIPSKMIGFNELLTSKDYDATIHFFIDDYQFERIWNNTNKWAVEVVQAGQWA